MQSVPLSEAKDGLSALVDRVEREHETIEITRHGRPAAIIMSRDALDSLYETLFWLSQPGVRDDVEAARRELRDGRSLSANDVRERFGLRPR